jgi:glycerophosphoryl diester phosphodiesterase
MKRFKFTTSKTILTLSVLVLLYGFSDQKKNTTGLHVLKLKNPKETKALLSYSGDPLPLISAHRGGPLVDFPENCLQTFENTLRSAFAIMECDPRYTRDSAIVLHHDPNLRRTTTGEGLLIDHTLEELKKLKLKDLKGNITEYQIPTLDEALEWAKGKTILVLDQKDVPVAARVRKIEEHKAEANAVLIVYSFEEAKLCYNLNRNIMMEVMIPNIEKAEEFEKTGVPWENVFAFVGHNLPNDVKLYETLHQKGVLCMAGSSRNVDRKFLTGSTSDFNSLKSEYDDFLNKGIDLIETDIPTHVGPLLFSAFPGHSSKAKYFSYK